MSRFPFTMYVVRRQAYEKQIRTEGRILCTACGNRGMDTVKTKWAEYYEVKSIRVIGASDTHYFVKPDEDGDYIREYPIEDCFDSVPLAEVEAAKRDSELRSEH